MRPFLFLVILIGSNYEIFGQKEASNWYFGARAGITFNNGMPVALTNGVINQSEGVATISDANGNLLFYTDGNKVWTRNHIEMPNGLGLYGDNQSAQSAVIVPMPNDPNIYFIFTVSNWPFTGSTAGLYYSRVDMRLNGGLGDVISKNTLLNANPREQVSAAFHANCRDVWIVSHEKGATNNFLSYLLTPAGVDPAPVISPVGMNYNGGNRYGYLRFSPDGNKLCSTLGYAITGPSTVITVQLYDFDKATGTVSNAITLADANFMRDAYASEFSSDNSKLYVCTYSSHVLYQYDLSSGNSATIAASALDIGVGQDIKSCLQMGPDKKIYVSKANKNFLAVIDDPNKRGPACNYIDDAIDLGTGRASLGLPNFLPGFFAKPNLGADRGICTGGTMLLNAYTKPGDTYLWQDGSNGATFNVTAPGTYWVEITSGSCVKRDEVNIIAGVPPVVNLGPDREICGTTTIRLNTYMSDATYLWQDGATSPIYSINAPGSYSVTVDLYGCVVTDAITVTAIAPPVVNLGNDTLVCGAPASLLLDAGSVPGNTYAWNSGATTPTLRVSSQGNYVVQVSNTGCTVSDAIYVSFAPMPRVDLGRDIDLCSTGPGPNLVFDATAGVSAVYEWQDGSSTPQYTVTAAGDYWVKVTERGCSKSDTVKIGIVTPPLLELGNDTTICAGTSLKLDAYTSPGNFYIWHDGSADSAIMVNTDGKYWVDVLNTGCMVSDTINLGTSPPVTVDLGNDTLLCNNGSIVLTPASIPGAAYHWQDGLSGNTYTVTSPGLYWVAVTDKGCIGKDTVLVNEMTRIDIGGDTGICINQTLLLQAASIPGATYVWQDGTTSPAYRVTRPGTYQVAVTTACGVLSDAMVVKQEDCACRISIPNAFSPDRNLHNDVFKPVIERCHFAEYNFRIFNRWGERVFETNNPQKGWDGLFKGQASDIGAYVYILTYRSAIADSKVVKHGTLMLVR